jgi:hypothetical protein
MNKFLCKEIKKRGKFKRAMCGLCTYTIRCIDYQEYTQGHSDELREASNTREGGEP